jgi:hypothetical protein
MVRIRGNFVGNFEYSGLNDPACHGARWLGYGGSGAPPSSSAHVSFMNVLGSEDSEGKHIVPVPVILSKKEDIPDLRLILAEVG